ncbi:3',5'-cyclic adenosine monophosphate phosphodiesterase CpdA [Paraburkholderia tropica]|uniref:phosphodiesterase n=1 Tax=Paraburkholderia tropica TaxID=92647 RepID=UPI001CB4410C|nr:phosphodiesterase [Paraburkholderia tropica]CAG9220304.1 3',5'-cyclic adenosine monophosphate phosphodiesterase CpdA [Paraburkholderia tropica]
MSVIAQISDIHVRPRGERYQDLVDSNAMFADAVDALNRLDPAPDFVLITGDLTDEGTPAEYAMLRDLLAPLRLPYAVMPGNHDHRENLRAAFTDQTWLPREGELHFGIDVGSIRLLALDSTVPGLHHGELSPASLDWLERELIANTHRRVMIAMHHPPFATGIPYLDLYGMADVRPLRDLVARHANVDRIVAGHVHRSMHTRLGSVPVLTCTSTTTQIALRLKADADPASFLEPPAFMLHRWSDDDGEGSAVSHLCYIGRFEGPMPFA